MLEGWARVLADIAAAPDDQALKRCAVEILESELGFYDDLIIELVEQEASHNARLRRALTVVWRGGMSDQVWERIQAIQATVTDPL